MNGKYWLRLRPEPGKKYKGLMGHFRARTKDEVVEEIKKEGVLKIMFIKHDDITEDGRHKNAAISGKEMLKIWKTYECGKSQKTPGDTAAHV